MGQKRRRHLTVHVAPSVLLVPDILPVNLAGGSPDFFRAQGVDIQRREFYRKRLQLRQITVSLKYSQLQQKDNIKWNKSVLFNPREAFVFSFSTANPLVKHHANMFLNQSNKLTANLLLFLPPSFAFQRRNIQFKIYVTQQISIVLPEKKKSGPALKRMGSI